MKTDYLNRQRNQNETRCSECSAHVEPLQGFLFENTRFLTSRGYHTKCLNCCDGTTQKRIKATQPKNITVPFAKKWVASLKVSTKTFEDGTKYCEIHDGEKLVIGYSDLGGQDYPGGWLYTHEFYPGNGELTSKAYDYLCDALIAAVESAIK